MQKVARREPPTKPVVAERAKRRLQLAAKREPPAFIQPLNPGFFILQRARSGATVKAKTVKPK